MKNGISKTLAVVILLSLGHVSLPAQAAKKEGVGKAIISIGKVFSKGKDGTENKLKRRGKVFEGDTITVGNKSRLQLRFVDNQLVVLKANTVFRIDEYKFKDKKDNNKSAALSLLKGGMRSVTGLIGKSARDKYKVKTPVATMGVRGTHYVIQICSGNCGAGVQGIVGTVLQGAIVMTNDAGTQQFGTDQFFNVPSNDEAPKTITNPPTVLISRATTTSDESEGSGDGDSTGTSTGDDGTGTTGDGTDTTATFSSTEQTAITTTIGDLNPTNPFIPGTPAPFGAGLVISGATAQVDGAGGGVAIEGVNGLIDIAEVNGVGNQPVSSILVDQFGVAEYQVKLGAVAMDQGGDPMLGINWGRWASDDVIFNDNGVEASLLTGLAFIYSPNLTPQAAIDARSDFTTYALVDGPGFRDETGAIVSGSLFVDIDFFSAEVIDFYGTISGNGRTYGVGIDLPMMVNAPLADLSNGSEIPIFAGCSGCPAGITLLTGSAGGAFVGPNAEALIGYFGLNGSDGAGTDIGVSGAGKFDDVGCAC